MASGERKLIVEITSARALMPKDGEGSSNAYCVVRSSFFVSVVAHVFLIFLFVLCLFVCLRLASCYLPYDEYGTGFAKLNVYLSFLLNLPAAGNLETYFGHDCCCCCCCCCCFVIVFLFCSCAGGDGILTIGKLCRTRRRLR
jgi:hypothetical protein